MLNRKVLLVDDDPLVLAGYKRLLEDCFYVQTANCAADGLDQLSKQGPFAAAVVDYVMPGMNGVEFVTRANRLAPRTTRIMITGKANLNMVIEALNRGNILLFLKKPTARDQLLHAVITAVEYYHNPVKEKALLDPEQLSGLAGIYSGLMLRDAGKYQKAAAAFNQSLPYFQQPGSLPLYLRATLYFAEARVKNCPTEPGQEADHELTAGIKTVLELLEEYSEIVTISEDKRSLKTVLQFAQDKQIRPLLAARLLSDFALSDSDSVTYQVTMFGAFQVRNRQGILKEKAWRNPKVKMLFLFLLTNRHNKIERDIVLETFWPEMKLKKAANNLTSYLYYLRQLFGKEVIYFITGHCWLDKSVFHCDVDQFEGLLSSGFQKLKEGRKEEAAAKISEALDLYRGSYLAEYSYEEWIVVERKRLQNLYTKALVKLADILCDQGLYEQAAEQLEKMPLIEEYDDEILFRIINSYRLAGKINKAKTRFEYYQAKLKEELNIEPDPKIKNLFN